MPQALSVWYLGAGAKVGGHALTWLAELDGLLAKREKGGCAFHVWPHEGLVLPTRAHVIAESYPALFPIRPPPQPGAYKGDDERDAWRLAAWAQGEDAANSLVTTFTVPRVTFGRLEGIALEDQVRFEGWMLGVR